MAALNLRQIIGRQPEAQALVAALADVDGRAGDRRGRRTASCFTATPPWRCGPLSRDRRRRQPRVGRRARPGAPWSHDCSSTSSAREVERRALATEVLNLYREVNLIYSFSEKLAALLDVERVARLTLEEARHLITATDGAMF